MNILPTTLSLIVTHQCTAACDHCCFSCTPKMHKSLPIDLAYAAIDSAKQHGTFKVVVFTGGECFLLNEELDKLVFYSTSQGFRTRCVTNGYWAKTYQKAKMRLEPLVKNGLSELNLSTGSFHQEYVPATSVLNAIRAAIDLRLIVVVTVEETEDRPSELNMFLDNKEFSTAIEHSKLMVRRSTWIKSDGISDIKHQASLNRFSEDRVSGCNTALRVIAVSPSADVFACCGLHMEKIENLKLGNLNNASLSEIINGHPDDLLKILIHVDGPERAYTLAKQFNPKVNLPGGCVHPCETCQCLHADDVALNSLVDNAEVYKKRAIQSYMVSLAKSAMTTATL